MEFRYSEFTTVLFINVVPSNDHGPRQDEDKSQERKLPSNSQGTTFGHCI